MIRYHRIQTNTISGMVNITLLTRTWHQTTSKYNIWYGEYHPPCTHLTSNNKQFTNQGGWYSPYQILYLFVVWCQVRVRRVIFTIPDIVLVPNYTTSISESSLKQIQYLVWWISPSLHAPDIKQQTNTISGMVNITLLARTWHQTTNKYYGQLIKCQTYQFFFYPALILKVQNMWL
jgi:hypothetical protein